MHTAFLMNAAVITASLLLSGRYFASKDFHYRALAFSIIFYAQIILILLFWGVAGKLHLGNILSSILIILLISYLLRRQSRLTTSGLGRSSDRVKRASELIEKRSPVIYHGESSLSRHGLRPRLECAKELSANKTFILCLSLLFGFGLVKLAINLINPPFGWDSLNYHFTFPVEWLKQQNLHNPITINDDLAPSYYPINGSLIYFWLMAPLKNVFLADLGQIPFFVISFLAVYGICRQLRIDTEYAFYAAALFTITPNYFKQTEIAYVDVMVCAWFLLGVYFWLSFYNQREIKDVILFSAGLGLLIGTKTTALPYGAVLFILFLIVLLAHCKSLGLKKITFFILSSCLLITAFGAYGYIRNYLETGNPLYPMKIQLFGKEIFKGVYDMANYSARVVSGDYSLNKILFREGLGSGVFIFLFPGFLFFILNIARKKAVKSDKFLILWHPPNRALNGAVNLGRSVSTLSVIEGLIFLLPLILFLIWRYVIPLANLRYLYPALALGYVTAFIPFSGNKPYNTSALCHKFLTVHKGGAGETVPHAWGVLKQNEVSAEGGLSPLAKVRCDYSELMSQRTIVRILAVLCFIASCAEISNYIELVVSFLLSIILFFSLRRIYALLSRLKIRHWISFGLLAFLSLYLLNIDYSDNIQ
jgi:hypothetical protein